MIEKWHTFKMDEEVEVWIPAYLEWLRGVVVNTGATGRNPVVRIPARNHPLGHSQMASYSVVRPLAVSTRLADRARAIR